MVQTPPSETTAEPLDALADILRLLSRYSFSVGDETGEEFGSQCQHWIEHLLLGKDIPSLKVPDTDEVTGDRNGPLRRNWKALRDFVADRRQREQVYVQELARVGTESLSDLQEGLKRERSDYVQRAGALNEII